MTVKPDLFARVDAMRQKTAEREAALLEAQRRKADDNRRRMPTVAGWVDQYRKVFGDEVKVVYACEGGVTVGQPSPAGVVPFVPAPYVPYARGRA